MNGRSKSKNKLQAKVDSKPKVPSKGSKPLPVVSKPGKSKPAPEPQRTKSKGNSKNAVSTKGKATSKSRNNSKSAPIPEVDPKSRRGGSKGASTKGKSSKEIVPEPKTQRDEASKRSQPSPAQRVPSRGKSKPKSAQIEPETQERPASNSRRGANSSARQKSSKSNKGKNSRSQTLTQTREDQVIDLPDERSQRSSRRKVTAIVDELPDETKKSKKSLKKAAEVVDVRKSAATLAENTTVSRSVSHKRPKSRQSEKVIVPEEPVDSRHTRKTGKSNQNSRLDEETSVASGRATRGKSVEPAERTMVPESGSNPPVRGPGRPKSKRGTSVGRGSEPNITTKLTDFEAGLLKSHVHVVANYGHKQTDLFYDRNYIEFCRIYTNKKKDDSSNGKEEHSSSGVPVKFEAAEQMNTDSMTIMHSHLQRVISKGKEQIAPPPTTETNSNLLLGQPVIAGQSKFYQVDSLLRTGVHSSTVLLNVLNRYTKEIVSRLFSPELGDYRKLRLESITEMIRLPGFAPKKYIDRLLTTGKQQPLPSSSSQPRPATETVLILDQLRIRVYVQGNLFAQTLQTARVVPRLENMFVDPQCKGVYFMSSDRGVFMWDLQSGEELLLHGFCDSAQPELKILNFTSMVRNKQSRLFQEVNSVKEITPEQFKKIGNLDEEKPATEKYHFLIGLCKDGTIEVLNTDTKKVFTISELKIYGESEIGKQQSDPAIGFSSTVVQSIGEQYFVVKQYNGQSKPMCIFVFDIDHSELVLNIKSSQTDHTVCEFFEHVSGNQETQLFCLFGNSQSISIAEVTKKGLKGLKEVSVSTYLPGLVADISTPGQILRGRSISNKIYLFGQFITDLNLPSGV